ncbi:MAG: hypothetical protein FWB90_01210 [Fibromonadales bacterium]|nr:hypothetical protein [Fibromonadales bacterium]
MSLSADVISRIIQFGSYAKGTATEEFAKTFDERMDRSRPVSRALLEINRLFSMDIIVYSKGEFEYLDKKEYVDERKLAIDCAVKDATISAVIQSKLEVASAMLAEGFDPAITARITKLPLRQINRLR